MSYIIEQKIKGHVYLYEVQSYWDPVKKQARQRRKYVGKKDQTQAAVTARKLPVVAAAADYGHLYLLKQIASSIGLVKAIQKSFPHELADALLSLACFQILDWGFYMSNTCMC